MAQTFRFKPEAFAKVSRRSTGIAALLLIAVVLIVPAAQRSSKTEFLFIAAIAVPAAVVGLWKGVRRQRTAWNSFELILSDEAITRRGAFCPDVVIRRESIARVRRHRGGLAVYGAGRSQVIAVSTDLDRFDELAEILTTWSPVEQYEPRLGPATVIVLVGLAVLGLHAALYACTDPRIVVPLGLLLAIGMLWCLWYLWHSPHVDRRLRRGLWLGIMPVLGDLIRVFQSLH